MIFANFFWVSFGVFELPYLCLRRTRLPSRNFAVGATVYSAFPNPLAG